MHQRVDQKHAWIVFGAALAVALFVIMQSYDRFLDEERALLDSARAPAVASRFVHAGRAWIEIDFGNGGRRMFEGDLGDLIYPLESGLRAASRAGDFTYEIRKGRIVELAGVHNAEEQWRVYRNRQRIQAAVEDITLAQGNTYTFRYER